MTGPVEGSRSRRRPKICWFDNIMAWTGLSGSRLLYVTRDRRCWRSPAHPRSLLIYHIRLNCTLLLCHTSLHCFVFNCVLSIGQNKRIIIYRRRETVLWRDM